MSDVLAKRNLILVTGSMGSGKTTLSTRLLNSGLRVYETDECKPAAMHAAEKRLRKHLVPRDWPDDTHHWLHTGLYHGGVVQRVSMVYDLVGGPLVIFDHSGEAFLPGSWSPPSGRSIAQRTPFRVVVNLGIEFPEMLERLKGRGDGGKWDEGFLDTHHDWVCRMQREWTLAYRNQEEGCPDEVWRLDASLPVDTVYASLRHIILRSVGAGVSTSPFQRRVLLRLRSRS